MPRHSDTRALPYTPEQMYALVADVGRYGEFLPWVSAIRVRSDNATQMIADMIVGFKGLRETFTSRVEKRRPEEVHVDYLAGPLKYLHNDWRFRPDGEGGCLVDFSVDFAFKNRVFEMLAGQVFDRALRKMIGAFETRAAELYGAADASAAQVNKLQAVLDHRAERDHEFLSSIDALDWESDPLGVFRGMLAVIRDNASRPGLLELHTVVSGEAASPEHPAHAHYIEHYRNLRTFYRESYKSLARSGLLAPDSSPEALATQTFYAACRRVLKPGGILVVNLWGRDSEFPEYFARLTRAFDGEVGWISVQNKTNVIVFAFAEPGAAARLETMRPQLADLSKRYGLDLLAIKRVIVELDAQCGAVAVVGNDGAAAIDAHPAVGQDCRPWRGFSDGDGVRHGCRGWSGGLAFAGRADC